jgi:hypothetical protein
LYTKKSKGGKHVASGFFPHSASDAIAIASNSISSGGAIKVYIAAAEETWPEVELSRSERRLAADDSSRLRDDSSRLSYIDR